MKDVIDSPRLAIPANLLHPPDGDSPPSQESVAALAAFAPANIPPGDITMHWPKLPEGGAPAVWITIEPLSTDRYPRQARVIDMVKRLVMTKASGPDVIFMRQPWVTDEQAGIGPTDEYFALRTVAELLSNAEPAGTLMIDGHVECHVFDRHGEAVMCMWDEMAPPAGREHWMLLEAGARQIDPWGRSTPLHGTGTEYAVRVGPMPTFVEALPTWLTALRQSFTIDPFHIEASFQQHTRQVRFTNPFSDSISGEVRLTAPLGWVINPARFAFSLAPDEALAHPITIRFPMNEPAGPKAILSRFEIHASRRYVLRVPAWIELGLEGIQVETFTKRDGDRVTVRQTVTNRTDEVVSFEGFLQVAERPRLHHLLANLEPGSTVSKQYTLHDTAALTGRRMRLGLREVGGPRVWNRLIEVP